MLESDDARDEVLDPVPHAPAVPLLHPARVIRLTPPAPPLDRLEYRVLDGHLLLPRGVARAPAPPPPGGPVDHGVAQRDLELVRVDTCRVEGLGVAVGEAPDGGHGVLEVPPLPPAGAAERRELPLEGVGPLHVPLGLLALRQLRRGRPALEQGQDGLARRLVGHGEVERGHAVVVLQVERVGVRLDQQLDDVDPRLVARGHVEGEAAVLVAVGRPLGEVHEENLDGVGRGLPHGRLVEGEVAHAVGLGGTLGVRLEERVDDVLRRLEGARGVEGEVAAVIDAGGLLGELGRLFVRSVVVKKKKWKRVRNMGGGNGGRHRQTSKTESRNRRRPPEHPDARPRTPLAFHLRDRGALFEMFENGSIA